MPAAAPRGYRGHRYPGEGIARRVWLYCCPPLSYRQVELLMAQRGVEVTCEASRRRRRESGQQYANELKRRRPKPGDTWHLDEVFLKLGGQTRYLWRAVDQGGNVLDILVHGRCNQAAAVRFFRKPLKESEDVPRVIITDKLGSHGAARKKVPRGVEHRQHKWRNHRAENSHRPTRQRERARQRFKSPGEARRFLAAFEPIGGHFRTGRHRLPAAEHRRERARRF